MAGLARPTVDAKRMAKAILVHAADLERERQTQEQDQADAA